MSEALNHAKAHDKIAVENLNGLHRWYLNDTIDHGKLKHVSFIKKPAEVAVTHLKAA
ncbi:hypothetical protein [Methylobacter svalbardensis]|uniref:hypothetical protein n=1 Tax=Methylobacter svalbardensis TaxID=3080016 RepID=UPI0030EDB2B7